MAKAYNKLHVHVIWATKYRLPLIQSSIESEIHTYISNQLRDQGCFVRIVNGMPDHVHCLFTMTRKKPIAAVVKQVKGSTSRYINKEQLIDQPFAWQRGYAVFSVSERALDRVYKYIRDQKKHHRRESYNNEIAILRARN